MSPITKPITKTVLRYILATLAIAALPVIDFLFILYSSLPTWAVIVASIFDIGLLAALIYLYVKAIEPIITDTFAIDYYYTDYLTLKECLECLDHGEDGPVLYVRSDSKWPLVFSINDLRELFFKGREPSGVTEKMLFEAKDKRAFTLRFDGIYPIIEEGKEEEQWD